MYVCSWASGSEPTCDVVIYFPCNGPAGSSALRANKAGSITSERSLIFGVHFAHFLNGQNVSSRRSVCCKKRPDTCRRTPREKQASETARLCEEIVVLVCQYSSDSTDIRLQRGQTSSNTKVNYTAAYAYCYILCFCPVDPWLSVDMHDRYV